MSTVPESDFDLEKLFLPAWAQEAPSSVKYAKYEGETERPDRRGERRGPRPPRRSGPPGGRGEGDRPRGGRGPSGREHGGAPGESQRSWQGPRGADRRGPPRERREPPAPLPEITVSLLPDERGVESLARQIKMTGRAFPLFDIAQMILQKPERHSVVFGIKKNQEGKPIQPLFVCALDDTLWLSEDEAISHVLHKHFATFYQAEKTATEPPKGKYTFVAQCGLSGTILGPPNYHDYQNQLRKLHGERFARMPFEAFKARVRIVKDEAVVKKWVEDQSWKTEYLCLNMPEPLRLPSMESVEKHFREQHKDNIIKPVESHTLGGIAARGLRSHELARLVRSAWEDQRRFPLQIATVLSQQFAGHGLQFFKVNKTITHVSVARPHYLDLTLTPVSEGVKRVVDYINTHPKCTRRKLFEALAPAPTVLPVAPPAAPEPTAPAAPESAAPQSAGVPPAPELQREPTAEQNALIADLHWLIHQGHVIEFANGTLETAKKPLPRPAKPIKPAAPGPETAEAQPANGAVAEAASPTGEATTTNAAAGENEAPPEPGESQTNVSTEAAPASENPENPAASSTTTEALSPTLATEASSNGMPSSRSEETPVPSGGPSVPS
ncbi:MAG TPA: hypothetical protein VG167_13830 [Verrucomicrobiae bacterium]|nr:hypothetical protein [Verrucomicrobiae bacterium]